MTTKKATRKTPTKRKTKVEAPQTPVQLTVYGQEDAIIDLQKRILVSLPSILPQSPTLTELEAFALAQVALLHGLSPFNGEIYFLKRQDGSPIGIMPGIKGYRKSAKRQLSRVENGATYWVEYIPVKPQDAGVTGADANEAVCYRAELRDSVTMRNYMKFRADASNIVYNAIKSSGGTIDKEAINALNDEVYSVVGKPPVIVSYGVVFKSEFERMAKARLSVHNQARIRAERGALRQRFDLEMLGVPSAMSETEASFLDEKIAGDADYVDATVVTPENGNTHEKQDLQTNLTQLGFPT